MDIGTIRSSSGSASRAQEAAIDALLDGPALLTGPVRSRDVAPANRKLSMAIDRFPSGFMPNAEKATARRTRLINLLTSAIQSTQTLSRLPGLRPDGHPDARQIAEAVARPMRVGSSYHTAPAMLDRLADLVDEYTAIEDEKNLADALEEFRMSQERSPVAELSGSTRHIERRRIIERFNSPLFPDVLVSTQIGGEGIDLHRFCRVVLHYDLSFNPAKLEQRTGRCDRIGSRAERESADLIVGVPLLAGSYDERIYATLLARDREQEALIGAGVGGEQGIAAIEKDREDDPDDLTVSPAIRPIPRDLVDLLRCSYHLWTPSE